MQLHEIDQALQAVGPFYRLVFDTDTAYAWGPDLDVGEPIAACSFQTGSLDGQTIETRVCTYAAGETPRRSPRRTDLWSSIYIDGRFVREAELSRSGNQWETTVADALGRQVRIQGIGQIPAEMHLATTRGDHFPDSRPPVGR